MNSTRPVFVWIVASLCAATVLAALAVVSSRVLEFERERGLAAAEAELSERVRLALWRMESEAAAMLTVENSRPTEQFSAFFSPMNSWDFAADRPAPGSTLVTSPLLEASPDHARLHFELDADGLRSPQVPKGDCESLAERLGKDVARVLESGERLAALGERLDLRPDLLPEKLRDRVHTIDSQVVNMAWNVVREPEPSPVRDEQRFWQSQVPNRAADAGYDRRQRAESVERTVGRAVLQNQELAGKIGNLFGAAERPHDPITADEQATDTDGLRLAESDQTDPLVARVAAEPGFGPAEDSLEAGAGDTADSPHEPTAAVLAVSPYQASWIGGDLFLIRRVGEGDGARIQGVWLENALLENELLNGIADLLPHATLTAVAPDEEAGPMTMVSLPYALEAGETPVPVAVGWTPTHALLAATWTAVGGALLASFALLAGVVRLSERRASFVSSVTHELRTPLTTFKLYSEMLADNMVPDADRRAEYFDTLCRESGRLSHLVENVLSYSRIERGSARSRKESTTAAALIERVMPRLRERAEIGGLGIVSQPTAEVMDLRLETDVTAVEQILFNLVDNAVKYGGGSEAAPIRLEVERRGRTLELRVCDDGPGVAPEMRRRLFRPFSKSAAEAAASQPGVGLGLALSRRLARSLGGDLVYQDGKSGACFALRLPLA